MTLPAGPPGPHPSPEELLDARRNAGSERSGAVLTHAALCAGCTEEEAALEAFESPEPLSARALDEAWGRFGHPEARPERSAWRLNPVVLALAATLVLAAGVAVLVSHRAPEDTRGGAPAVQLLAPKGTLAEPPTEFLFTLPGPAPARVSVFDASQSYLWRSEPVRKGRVEFPQGEGYKIVPGAEYFWMVETGGDVTPAQPFTVR